MFIGAFAGAALFLHVGTGLPLLIAAVAVAGAAVVFRLSRAPALLDTAH
jgi:hypothetical protein